MSTVSEVICKLFSKVANGNKRFDGASERWLLLFPAGWRLSKNTSILRLPSNNIFCDIQTCRLECLGVHRSPLLILGFEA